MGMRILLKQSLLAARSVGYIDPASGGSSGIYLAKLFEKLGIADQLKPKSVLVKGGLVAEKIASGGAEIGMQQMSELLVVPGVVVVGPIPLDVQHYTIYGGAIATASDNRLVRSISCARTESSRSSLDNSHDNGLRSRWSQSSR